MPASNNTTQPVRTEPVEGRPMPAHPPVAHPPVAKPPVAKPPVATPFPPEGGTGHAAPKPLQPSSQSGTATAADGTRIAWSTAGNGTITVTGGTQRLVIARTQDAAGHREVTSFFAGTAAAPYLRQSSFVATAGDSVTIDTTAGNDTLGIVLAHRASAPGSVTATVSGRLRGTSVEWTGTVPVALPLSLVKALPAAVSNAFASQFRAAGYFAPALRQLVPGGTPRPQPVRAPVGLPPGRPQPGRFGAMAEAGGAKPGGSDGNKSVLGALLSAGFAFGLVEGVGAVKGSVVAAGAGPEAVPIGAPVAPRAPPGTDARNKGKKSSFSEEKEAKRLCPFEFGPREQKFLGSSF